MNVDNHWTPDICIYHANCADGFGAAVAVWERWASIPEYREAAYGDAPPDVAGKNVLIVDFSYPSDVLTTMAQTARSIVILDHHKTAECALFGFPAFYGTHRDVCRALKTARGDVRNVLVNFDQHRSGAVMAYQFAFPERPVPELLEYVQDRDLWRFNLENSREINAYIGSLDHDFGVWDALFSAFNDVAMAKTGAVILRLQKKNLDALLDATTRSMVIAGQAVPVANVPFYMASEAGNILSEGNPFAATYFDHGDGYRQFSLRSAPDGADVSEIAKRYGGGGHKHAAGFTRPIGWEGEA